jgi:hypothetical protein
VVNFYALMLLFNRRTSSSNWTTQQQLSSSNWTTQQRLSSSNWTTQQRLSSSNWITPHRISRSNWMTRQRLSSSNWTTLLRASGSNRITPQNLQLQLDDSTRIFQLQLEILKTEIPEQTRIPTNHVRVHAALNREHGCYNSFTLCRGCTHSP